MGDRLLHGEIMEVLEKWGEIWDRRVDVEFDIIHPDPEYGGSINVKTTAYAVEEELRQGKGWTAFLCVRTDGTSDDMLTKKLRTDHVLPWLRAAFTDRFLKEFVKSRFLTNLIFNEHAYTVNDQTQTHDQYEPCGEKLGVLHNIPFDFEVRAGKIGHVEIPNDFTYKIIIPATFYAGEDGCLAFATPLLKNGCKTIHQTSHSDFNECVQCLKDIISCEMEKAAAATGALQHFMSDGTAAINPRLRPNTNECDR